MACYLTRSLQPGYVRFARGLRNFSRNRPETTNLNHQYASRRMFIVRPSIPEMAPTGMMDSAKARERM